MVHVRAYRLRRASRRRQPRQRPAAAAALALRRRHRGPGAQEARAHRRADRVGGPRPRGGPPHLDRRHQLAAAHRRVGRSGHDHGAHDALPPVGHPGARRRAGPDERRRPEHGGHEPQPPDGARHRGVDDRRHRHRVRLLRHDRALHRRDVFRRAAAHHRLHLALRRQRRRQREGGPPLHQGQPRSARPAHRDARVRRPFDALHAPAAHLHQGTSLFWTQRVSRG